MIIYALVIIAIFFFVACNLFMKNPMWHWTMTVISSVLLLISIAVSIGNFRYHYGMHLINHSRTEKLASMNPQQSMLVYEKLGSAKNHSIVVFKHNANGKQMHTKADSSVKNRFIYTKNQHPYLKVTHKKWEYKNNWMREWFGLAMKSKTKSTVNKFYVPRSWTILSANQAKTLKKIAKIEAAKQQKKMAAPQTQTMMKQKSSMALKAELSQAMKKNPNMTTSQRQAFMVKAKKDVQTKIKEQAQRQIMAEAITQAKKTPVGYVK